MTELLEIFGTFLVSPWLLGTDLGICMVIYGINHVLVCMRPKLTVKFVFTK